MRIVKTAVWIAILYVLQTTFSELISIYDAVAELMLVFAVSYAMNERSLKTSAIVTVICAVLSGAAVGRSFALAVLVIGCAGIFAHTLTGRVRFIPKCVKAVFVIFVSSLVLGAGEALLFGVSPDINAMLWAVVPYTAYTVLAACVLYPIIVKTFTGEDKPKYI